MGNNILEDFFDGKTYTVMFENSGGYRRNLGEATNMNETFAIIKEFLDENNYKSYYSRVANIDGELMIDVGSHTEFFYVGEWNGGEA